MAKRKQNDTESSLLNTNSAKAALEEKREQSLSKQQILKVVAVIAAVVVFVATLLVVGGIVSKNIEQKEWLRQPDGSMSAFYSEVAEAEIKDGDMDAIITEAYYTNEKGLLVKLNFSNGCAEEQRVTKIFITIRDTNEKGEVIAAGNTDKINKKTVVPAGGNFDFELYLPPQYVKVKNNSLKKIQYDITMDCLLAR